MAKEKMSWWKAAGLGLLIALAVASLGYSAYVAADATMRGQTVGEAKIDQTKLYIGVPRYQEGAEVKLTLFATSGKATKEATYSSTNIDQMTKLSGQDATCVFLDYAASPLFSSSLSIGKWLADDGNTLMAQTSCLGAKITSAKVAIDLSGVWFVNCASKDGEEPYNWSAGKNHSYITVTTIYGGSQEASK